MSFFIQTCVNTSLLLPHNLCWDCMNSCVSSCVFVLARCESDWYLWRAPSLSHTHTHMQTHSCTHTHTHTHTRCSSLIQMFCIQQPLKDFSFFCKAGHTPPSHFFFSTRCSQNTPHSRREVEKTGWCCTHTHKHTCNTNTHTHTHTHTQRMSHCHLALRVSNVCVKLCRDKEGTARGGARLCVCFACIKGYFLRSRPRATRCLEKNTKENTTSIL